MKYVISLLLPALAFSATAMEIELGGRTIAIVVPDGYTELLPTMSPYYESMQAFVAPSNNRYLTLITESDAQAILGGQDADFTRYMTIESEKNLSQSSISSAVFDELRDVLRTQLDQVVAEANRRVPGLIEDGTRKVNESFGTDLELSVGEMIALPIHADSEDTMAYSMYMKMGTSNAGESLGEEVVVATTQVLHVKDKVMFIYVYGAEDDLDWTREFAANWSARLLDANPLSSAVAAAREQSGSGGIDWNRVVEKAFIGALIGAVIALVAAHFRRRKKKNAA